MSTTPIMARIRLANAKYLLRIIDASDTFLANVIEDSYSRHAVAYAETLSFLTALEVLRCDNDRILPGVHFAETMAKLTKSPTEYTLFLFELAIASRSEYGQELRRILLGFSSSGSTLSMTPPDARDPGYAARDVLVSAGVVLLDHETGVGTLRPEFHSLYGLALSCEGMPPENVVELEEENRDLGHRAELMVLAYERNVVGSRYANQVVHVARYSASAGFDIASLRVKAAMLLESRLIEVKAVSGEDFGFFLSSQEATLARRSGDTYFLYLVPIRNGDPARDELVIIRDPARNVLDAPEDWEVEASGYHCKRRLER